jgi:hypothetical protein
VKLLPTLWRKHSQAESQVAEDARALILRFGDSAYDEARTRAREARLGRTVDANRPVGHWDKVRREIGRRTGRDQRVDTATRYLSPSS